MNDEVKIFSMCAQTVEALVDYLMKLPPDMDVCCNNSSYFYGIANTEENELNFTDIMPDEWRENKDA